MNNYIFDLGPYSKIHCGVHSDPKNHVIHILDLHGPTPVHQLIRQLQGRILLNEKCEGKSSEWIWFLYGTDATVSRFDNLRPVIESGFTKVMLETADSSLLNPDFIRKMQVLSELGIT